MLARGLEPDYPPAAVAEVEAIRAAAAPGSGTRDLRDRLWCSIDNDDSRDLDQLSVAEPPAGGAGHGPVKILVAVADVDALVHTDTAIDGHAARNTTSVYTAGGTFPMLPEQLSTDLTSLNPDVDRLAIVIEMTVDADGALSDVGLSRALVRNHAQLAYNAVAAWLDGGPTPPRIAAVPGLAEQLRLQDRVAQALKTSRHAQGALSLETLEARAVFSDGRLEDLRVEERNRAKDLIEDFMIAANGVTARFLGARGLPSLRRVLRSPERWQRIVDLAAQLGERLPDAPDARALEAFLVKRKAADPEGFPDLSLSIVKLMGRGEYVVDVPGRETEGHFGLAVSDYAHSTAPNRRFPDLITQRLVKAALGGRPAPYGEATLVGLARHCTEQEDNANKVERQVRKSAAALLLLHRVGERFAGLVTGASAKGTWVRIAAPPIEGRVVRGFAGMDVGDRVTVELLGVDVERGFIDFGRA
jgi:exoribonuclease II